MYFDGHHVYVPDAVLNDDRLSFFEYRVYKSLLALSTDLGWCFATPARIARDAGLSQRTVKASILRLGRRRYLRLSSCGRAIKLREFLPASGRVGGPCD